ncbi:MAG: NTP transferase domain-containing protein [Limisphaerales bacterium]
MKNRLPSPVTTALLLAAGTGSRLSPLTHESPKCLTELNGQSFLARLVDSLVLNGIRRLIVVVGHLDSHIRDHLAELDSDLEIEFVDNRRFRTTNNIYSLWLARFLIREPFILVECDLIFEPAQLKPLLNPDRMAISRRLPWMNGSTVTVDQFDRITAFHADDDSPSLETTFKTVNIYSFSLKTWERVLDRLRKHIVAERVTSYYETVLAELVDECLISLDAVYFDEDCWYEVDTVADLRAAEQIFPASCDQDEPVYA